jgi:transposase
MEVLYPCCCGLDVHKKSITACVLWAEEKGKSRKEKRRFGTFTQDLLRLADWLRECRVTHVAMESTGAYWKPVCNILEGQFEVLLVTARKFCASPTDTRTARSHPVSGEFDAGDQPHRQSRSALSP